MEKSTVTQYLLGLILSLILTIGSYLLVVSHFFSNIFLTAIIVILGLIQMVVQLSFFLHVDQEEKPRLNLVMFISTFGIILIVILGSIWIMNHLNYNMMASPQAVEQYVKSQDGF